MENHHFFYGKTHYKWPFSIAMFVYQRVHYSFHTSFQQRKKLLHEIQGRNSAPWQQSAEERQVLGGKVGDLLLRIASHRLEEGKICGAMTWWEVDR